MPAWKGILKDEQIQDLVDYLHTGPGKMIRSSRCFSSGAFGFGVLAIREDG